MADIGNTVVYIPIINSIFLFFVETYNKIAYSNMYVILICWKTKMNVGKIY